METLNQHRKQSLNNCIKKLDKAISKFKFDGSLSIQDCCDIRKDVYEAQTTISDHKCYFNDQNGEFKKLTDMVNFLERALEKVDPASGCI